MPIASYLILCTVLPPAMLNPLIMFSVNHGLSAGLDRSRCQRPPLVDPIHGLLGSLGVELGPSNPPFLHLELSCRFRQTSVHATSFNVLGLRIAQIVDNVQPCLPLPVHGVDYALLKRNHVTVCLDSLASVSVWARGQHGVSHKHREPLSCSMGI